MEKHAKTLTTDQFNESVDKFSDNLYRFILKNIKDEAKAKDVIQDSFEKSKGKSKFPKQPTPKKI